MHEIQVISLCLSEKAITFIPKTTLKESNIHIHPSVICVNIWAVINKSSVSKVDVHLESVCRLSDSVYNSWSFPPTSPSQCRRGHPGLWLLCSDCSCCMNQNVEDHFKYCPAFYSSQNLLLEECPQFFGASARASQIWSSTYKMSEWNNRSQCRFISSCFFWVLFYLPL